VILIDIGNTRAHVYQDGVIEHINVEDAIVRHHAHRVHYINVNPHNVDALSALASWRNLGEVLHIEGEYDGMGVDRKALCLSHETGIFIDAGSAITVDRVEDGVYQGGFILPGLHACRRTYATISPVLDTPLQADVALDALPKSTQGSVSFGIMASIVSVIERVRGALPLYITGGDGAQLASYFEGAVHDETLVFRGMQTIQQTEIQ
jgi:type III pantothenate kinase